MDYGDPVSYLVLTPGIEVISSDGKRVGKLDAVLADEGTSVFDGIVIDMRSGPGGRRFVDADQVGDLYERAVVLPLTADEILQLPEPTAAPPVVVHRPPGRGLLDRFRRR